MQFNIQVPDKYENCNQVVYFLLKTYDNSFSPLILNKLK